MENAKTNSSRFTYMPIDGRSVYRNLDEIWQRFALMKYLRKVDRKNVVLYDRRVV